MAERTISDNGIEFIAGFEGCRLSAYDDLQPSLILTAKTKIKGTLTIGIGHTGRIDGKAISWNSTITKDKAYDLFKQDISSRITQLNSQLKVRVTQNMFDALLSYVYNCGFGNNHYIKAINYINNGDFVNASLEIKNGTNTSKGIVLAGLTRRRNAEYELFIKNMNWKYKTTKDGVALREKPSQDTNKIQTYKNGTTLYITEIKKVSDKRYGKVKGTSYWINLKYTKLI